MQAQRACRSAGSSLPVLVDDRGYAVVGTDLEELGLELLALADIDAVDAIVETGFLQHDVDFVAVRRGPGINVYHRDLPKQQL